MRLLAFGISALLVLQAGAAYAASGKGGSEAGKGGPSGGGPSGGGGPSSASGGRPEQRDAITGKPLTDKAWEVEAAYEEHGLLVQNQTAERQTVQGYAALYGRYDVTPNDRIQLRLGMYINHFADQQESGVRADDFILSYTHYFQLPGEVTARALVWVTAPTSFDSQLQSNITTPRIAIGAERNFFKYINLDVRAAADYYIDKYATAAGGSPNQQFGTSLLAGIILTAPFHEPLQLGASAATSWAWYYKILPQNAPGYTGQGSGQLGAVQDAKQNDQAIQQAYYYELYLRYNFPVLYGLKSDLTLAVATGDPTMGYASVHHDGTSHVYLGWVADSQVFGALDVRY